MNIFACDRNPYKAAEYLPDKLVVKMITESVQMLSTIARERGYNSSSIYRKTHTHHPCVNWLRQDDRHIDWLISHTIGLNNQYELRYGQVRKHKAFLVLKELLLHNIFPYKDSREEVETFALAMPKQYRLTDPIESYRLYMQKEKSYYSTWKSPSEKPGWWKEPCKGD